jgi:hypothetical protein
VLLSSSSSLRETGRDRERHPVAVRLRSNGECSRIRKKESHRVFPVNNGMLEKLPD